MFRSDAAQRSIKSGPGRWRSRSWEFWAMKFEQAWAFSHPSGFQRYACTGYPNFLLDFTFSLVEQHAARRSTIHNTFQALSAGPTCRKLSVSYGPFEHPFSAGSFPAVNHEDYPRALFLEPADWGDAICVEFAHPLLDDQLALFLQCVCTRKREAVCPPGPSPGARVENEATGLQPIRKLARKIVFDCLPASAAVRSPLDAMHLLDQLGLWASIASLTIAKVALRGGRGVRAFHRQRKTGSAPRYFSPAQTVAAISYRVFSV